MLDGRWYDETTDVVKWFETKQNARNVGCRPPGSG